MKVLATSSNGDPLFVRDERGHDFEVEVHWATDARFRNWAKDTETEWDELWDKVFSEHPPLAFEDGQSLHRVVADRRKVKCDLIDEPLLVKPAFRIFAAHYLPSLAERDEHEHRARALVRLGGNPPEDEIAARRDEAHGRLWDQQHAKARPSHPSVWLSDRDLFSGLNTFQMSSAFENTLVENALKNAHRTPVFFEINLVHGLVYNGKTSTAPIPPEFETLDETHVRRQEALKRLQDPPVPDIDLVKSYLDGLWNRPVL